MDWPVLHDYILPKLLSFVSLCESEDFDIWTGLMVPGGERKQAFISVVN